MARRALAWLRGGALVAVALASRPVPAQAGDPQLVWKTIHTKHFKVHTHERLLPVGQRVAAIAEDVHARLSGPLGWDPSQITQVLLTDETDSANGSATSLPLNTVRLFVTAPDDLSPLSDYDDWHGTLITHEYTHILHTDHITGLPAVVNAILGKTYSPNQMQPRWILEGLAVLLESKVTAGGRERSTIFDMYLRADVLEDNIAGLDEISHSPRRWPQGNLWYLYGSHFLQWIESVYGFEALRQVAADYGSEIIPYGINRAIHRATGKTYVELYKGWIASMKQRYGAQKAAVVARGLREGRRVTFHGQEASHPRYMPDAAGVKEASALRRIAYYRSDGHTTTGLYAVPARADGTYGLAKLITRTAGPATPAFFSDGGLLYDSIDFAKFRIYSFWDLFRRGAQDWGDEADQGKRLSFGLRASEPTVSPDGSQVVFTVNKAGTSYLYAADLGDPDLAVPGLGTPRKLFPQVAFDQVYTPRFSPDGKKVAYSAWHKGGYRDVEILDLATGAVTKVTDDRALDTGPVFSPDGKRLFFSSDRTGIANVYAYEIATGALRQVTNVIGGAYQPDVSADGKHLVYVGYSHTGSDLWELDLDQDKWLAALPYVDDRPPPREYPSTIDAKVAPYDPLPTLRPYAWDFTFAPDAFGQALTITTRGGDTVGLHSFAAAITASFVRGFSGVDLAYYYNRLPTALRMRAYQFLAPRGGYRANDQTPTWVERSQGIEAGLTAPLSWGFDGQSVAMSYTFSHFAALDGFPATTPDPYSRMPVIPQTGFLAALRFGWAWSNVQRFLWSVGGEKGFALSAGVDLYRPELAGQYTVFAANYNAVGYFPMPWLRHHVLALHAQGGASIGDFARRGAYGLGGFAEIPLPDALRNLLIQPGIALRGYKPGARFGDAFMLYNAEYRFPLLNVDHGVQTVPFFLQRVYGNLFADYGEASFATMDLTKLKLGLGAEILVDFAVGYFQPLTLRLGVAKGTSEGGITQTYTVLSSLY